MKCCNKTNEKISNINELSLISDSNIYMSIARDQKNINELNLNEMDEYALSAQGFHGFAVENNLKFLAYLLEMVCMEAVNVKLLADNQNQCAPASQKASHY